MLRDADPLPKEARAFVEACLAKSRGDRLGAAGWRDLFAAPWLADLEPGDLDDKDKIPFVPPANGQHVPDEIDIGEFPDLGKKVKLEPGDFDEDAWTFVSPKAFGTEIVWFLKWKEKKDATSGGEGAGAASRRRSSACAIS